jgi:hypothetical protein
MRNNTACPGVNSAGPRTRTPALDTSQVSTSKVLGDGSQAIAGGVNAHTTARE